RTLGFHDRGRRRRCRRGFLGLGPRETITFSLLDRDDRRRSRLGQRPGLVGRGCKRVKTEGTADDTTEQGLVQPQGTTTATARDGDTHDQKSSSTLKACSF